MKKKAWSFKAVGQDDLRYFGNNGYQDDSASFYQYDNFVANHKQVKEGDIVIITDRVKVLGVSMVSKISSAPYLKARNRCPELDCKPKKLTFRKNKEKKWRCNNGHQFHQPKLEEVEAREFKAFYEEKYRPIDSVSMGELISHTPRYNVQSSIQEIDFAWATSLLEGIVSLDPAEGDPDDIPLDTTDQRKAVLKHIKQRRGQQSFRSALIAQQAECAISGCKIVDILEAAHITAYRNDTHNTTGNGLLLRCDIHTLFDLDLFAIEPDTYTIYFSASIQDEAYLKYHGRTLMLPYKMNKDALAARWLRFLEKDGVPPILASAALDKSI